MVLQNNTNFVMPITSKIFVTIKMFAITEHCFIYLFFVLVFAETVLSVLYTNLNEVSSKLTRLIVANNNTVFAPFEHYNIV